MTSSRRTSVEGVTGRDDDTVRLQRNEEQSDRRLKRKSDNGLSR